MVRTQDLNHYTFDDVERWGLVLNEISWAIRSTHYTTTKASPIKLVFGRDMLFSIPFVADQDKIAQNKQIIINKSNQAENKTRLEHDYVITEKVLIYQDGHFRKLEGPFLGPYEIIQIYTNGTVQIQRGATTEHISIWRMSPYTTEED